MSLLYQFCKRGTLVVFTVATFVRDSLAGFWLAGMLITNDIRIEAPKTRMRRRC
jgi:hypothetical protein